MTEHRAYSWDQVERKLVAPWTVLRGPNLSNYLLSLAGDTITFSLPQTLSAIPDSMEMLWKILNLHDWYDMDREIDS